MEKPNYGSLFRWSLGMTTLLVATFGVGLRQKPPHDLTVVLTVIIGGFCAGLIVGGIVCLIQWRKYKNWRDDDIPAQDAGTPFVEKPAYGTFFKAITGAVALVFAVSRQDCYGYTPTPIASTIVAVILGLAVGALIAGNFCIVIWIIYECRNKG